MKHRATRYYIERDDRIKYPRILDLQAEPTAGQHYRRTYRDRTDYEAQMRQYEQMRAQAEFQQACRARAAEARRAQQQAQYTIKLEPYDFAAVPFFIVIGFLLMWAITEILITIHS